MTRIRDSAIEAGSHRRILMLRISTGFRRLVCLGRSAISQVQICLRALYSARETDDQSRLVVTGRFLNLYTTTSIHHHCYKQNIEIMDRAREVSLPMLCRMNKVKRGEHVTIKICAPAIRSFRGQNFNLTSALSRIFWTHQRLLCLPESSTLSRSTVVHCCIPTIKVFAASSHHELARTTSPSS